jgi:F-type H+-transporting ATPase subunit gamma
MASLKDVQTKIGSIKKTKQITRAMNMVATSRLRGAQTNMEAFRPYAMKFSQVLGSVAEKTEGESNALLVPREDVKNVHIVLCTSDRALCGGFNANLIKKAEAFHNQETAKGRTVSFTGFGKKGRDWCRKNGMTIHDEHIGVIGGKIAFSIASTEGRKLVDGFLGGRYDEVHVVCARFASMTSQVPVLQQLLPIPPIEKAVGEDAEGVRGGAILSEHLFEPSAHELMADILPRSVSVQLFSALLETSTSEHAARMSAMENATNACNDMIDELELAYNKARQAAITAELMDIVGGAEALKG